MAMNVNERAARWRKANRDKLYDTCSCGKEKQKLAKKCRTCWRVSVPSGALSPFYKGGYQRKLLNNKIASKRRQNMEGSHSEAEWVALKAKVGNICVCCKKPESELVLRKDHIIPVTKGGTDYISNIQPLCDSCNSRKYTYIINYLELLEEAGAGL